MLLPPYHGSSEYFQASSLSSPGPSALPVCVWRGGFSPRWISPLSSVMG